MSSMSHPKKLPQRTALAQVRLLCRPNRGHFPLADKVSLEGCWGVICRLCQGQSCCLRTREAYPFSGTHIGNIEGAVVGQRSSKPAVGAGRMAQMFEHFVRRDHVEFWGQIDLLPGPLMPHRRRDVGAAQSGEIIPLLITPALLLNLSRYDEGV